jgi:hypothetical protein
MRNPEAILIGLIALLATGLLAINEARRDAAREYFRYANLSDAQRDCAVSYYVGLSVKADVAVIHCQQFER